jgi:hypothetical protein
MDSRFTQTKNAVDRLKKDYANHSNLVIAFDFDDTVFDYHHRGDTYSQVIDALRRAQDHNLSLTCLTRVYKMDDLIFKSKYIEQVLRLTLDTDNNRVNLNANAYGEDDADLFEEFYNKPFFNLLLDDKAGLGQALEILQEFLNYLDVEYPITKAAAEYSDDLLNDI